MQTGIKFHKIKDGRALLKLLSTSSKHETYFLLVYDAPQHAQPVSEI